MTTDNALPYQINAFPCQSYDMVCLACPKRHTARYSPGNGWDLGMRLKLLLRSILDQLNLDTARV